MHHFFVSPDMVKEDKIIIKGMDVNHIKNVLRMKPGDELLVSDGMGHDYLSVIDKVEEDEVVACITRQTFSGAELGARIYLFQALPKGDKMETIIQKAVELGAYSIVPVRTSRCVVKLDAKKAGVKKTRWNAIAQSAAKQSRRSIIPQVGDIMGFDEALQFASKLDACIIPYENYKDMARTSEVIKGMADKGSIGIFIGPEGGFAPEEIEAACRMGLEQISLGGRILRTETAGMTILSVLMFMIESAPHESKEDT